MNSLFPMQAFSVPAFGADGSESVGGNTANTTSTIDVEAGRVSTLQIGVSTDSQSVRIIDKPEATLGFLFELRQPHRSR